jgi:hypothetical protein
MQHTAIIGVGLPQVTITFNCADPNNSVTGTYGPGTHTDSDNCSVQFVSATVAGVVIAVGLTLDVTIDGIAARATVTTNDQGRHVTVELSTK